MKFWHHLIAKKLGMVFLRVCRPMSNEECAMKDSTVFESGMGELGLGIEGVLRRAARSRG